MLNTCFCSTCTNNTKTHATAGDFHHVTATVLMAMNRQLRRRPPYPELRLTTTRLRQDLSFGLAEAKAPPHPKAKIPRHTCCWRLWQMAKPRLALWLQAARLLLGPELPARPCDSQDPVLAAQEEDATLECPCQCTSPSRLHVGKRKQTSSHKQPNQLAVCGTGITSQSSRHGHKLR